MQHAEITESRLITENSTGKCFILRGRVMGIAASVDACFNVRYWRSNPVESPSPTAGGGYTPDSKSTRPHRTAPVSPPPPAVPADVPGEGQPIAASDCIPAFGISTPPTSPGAAFCAEEDGSCTGVNVTLLAF